MKAEALVSAVLADAGFSHAFFTRRGGVSPADIGPLNFAVSAGDDPARVAENVVLAAAELGVPAARVYFLSQVHGVAHALLDGSEALADVVTREGDVTVAREPGVACGVRTADCVPVLVADRRSGAAAAIHSGWKGTVLDVVAAGVAALRVAVGDGEPELVAAIGPHIERCCFEVDADVAGDLARASSLGRSVVDERAGGKSHVDLRAIVRAQLVAAGVTDAAIGDVPGCTVCDVTRFHSFRRDAAGSGRMLSAIVSRAAR
jgi:hypothetical protein